MAERHIAAPLALVRIGVAMTDLVMPPGEGLAASGILAKKRRPVRFGLATRVLLLNTAFVIAAATMIYIPAIANYRDNWLRQRLSAAYTAALVLDAAPQAMVPPELSRQLLDSVGARIIVLSKHGTKRILAASELPRRVDEVYDFREFCFLAPARRGGHADGAAGACHHDRQRSAHRAANGSRSPWTRRR